MKATEPMKDAIQRSQAEKNENKTTSSDEEDDAPQERANHTQSEHHTESLERQTVSGPLGS